MEETNDIVKSSDDIDDGSSHAVTNFTSKMPTTLYSFRCLLGGSSPPGPLPPGVPPRPPPSGPPPSRPPPPGPPPSRPYPSLRPPTGPPPTGPPPTGPPPTGPPPTGPPPTGLPPTRPPPSGPPPSGSLSSKPNLSSLKCYTPNSDNPRPSKSPTGSCQTPLEPCVQAPSPEDLPLPPKKWFGKQKFNCE